MATPTIFSRSHLRLASWAGAIFALALITPSCTAEAVLEAQSLDCAGPDGCAVDGDDGDDPASFCDDHDPCTDDANCTPCSTLPPSEQSMYRCTADANLPAFCAGHSGCFHVSRTTPAEQINDCFPVSGAADLHAGVCRAGSCVENGG